MGHPAQEAAGFSAPVEMTNLCGIPMGSGLLRDLDLACGGVVAVGEGFEEVDDLILFLVGELKIADGHVEILSVVAWRKAVDVEALAGAGLTGVELVLVAGVVEVDYVFEVLEVAVVHVGLDEGMRRKAGAEIDVAEGGRLHGAVEVVGVLSPGFVRVGSALEEGSEAGVMIVAAGGVGGEAVAIGPALGEEREGCVAGNPKIGEGVVGKEGLKIGGDRLGAVGRGRGGLGGWRPGGGAIVLGSVEMAGVAVSLGAKEFPAAQFVGRKLCALVAGEIEVEL